MSLFEVKAVDKTYYKDRLEDFLPDSIFDVHTHVYLPQPPRKGEVRTVTWPALVADKNPIEDLMETAQLMFPGKTYVPLMFGTPTKGVDLTAPNTYISDVAAKTGFPSLLLAHPKMSATDLESAIQGGGFKGIKVYLTFAPLYIPVPQIRIFDFLTHEHLAVCDKLGCAVMLHISRDARLRDPVNVAQLQQIENTYKNLKLIVAHVGRAYCNSDVGDALDILSKTDNMVFDFAANTNGWVFEQLIRAVGPSRIMFGSDLPIARMRMRRIEEDGVYKNVVPRGLYGDVRADKNMKEVDPPEADALSFFMYETIEAFRQASINTELSRNDIEKVFWQNGKDMFGFK
ncbi:MAG: amidohydrolase family protein [Clostridia bacterium]|nr:amidohydrolase family protein [Clostridia bacterium]